MPENILGKINAPFARRPLLGLVFFFLAGVFSAAAWLVGLDFAAVLFLAALVLSGAVVCRWLGRFFPGKAGMFSALAKLFVWLAIFGVGWLAFDLRVNDPSPLNLARLMDKPREGVEIIGVVADDPALRKSPRGDYQSWSFILQVEALSRTGAFEKARGAVSVSLPAVATSNARAPAGRPAKRLENNPHYGERWQLSGVLTDKARFAEAGLAAVQAQLPCRFSFHVLEAPKPLLICRPSSWNFLHRCFQLRQICSDILARGIKEKKPEAAAILQALVLGRQHELPFLLREAFSATGTYHIFAISGQHVAILALFVIAVLQAYGVCRLRWFYFLAPVLIVFTVMTGLSASALRGCLMALVCFLGPLFKRKTDISSAMALAALLIVAVDPRQLFQAGFLLSFGIVAGLIVLCPPLIEIARHKLETDPYQLAPESAPRRVSRKVIAWILFMAIASGAAWLVSTPLMARWFNLVSFVALPANLLVIPLATLVLFLGCLAIIFGWCPFIPELFNQANALVVAGMVGLTRILAQAPFGHVYVKSPPLGLILLWLCALLVWRIWYQKKKVWISAFLIFVAVAGLAGLSQRKAWEIHVVNLGASAVCLVNSAQGSVLINSGPGYQARRVVNYLRRQGVNRLQALILPGPDAEHGGGARDLAGAMPVKEIILGGAEPKSRPIRELLLFAEKRRINIREAGAEENGLLFSSKCFAVHSNKTAGPEALALPKTISIIGGARASLPSASHGRSAVLGRIFKIMIAEENSGFSQALTVSNQTACRVVCRPYAEAREWPPRDLPDDLRATNQIVLGPGQGIVFTPEKDNVKINPVLLAR